MQALIVKVQNSLSVQPHRLIINTIQTLREAKSMHHKTIPIISLSSWLRWIHLKRAKKND